MANTEKAHEEWRGLYLGDAVYGANDGIITTFAVVSGAAGAGISSGVIVILGIANLIADGISMGLSNYLSLRSKAEYQKKLGITENAIEKPSRHGLATSISFVFCGALPLIPYIFGVSSSFQFPISIVATAISLFLVGSLRNIVTSTGWLRSGIEMLLVGGLAASAAYGIGLALKTLFGIVV